MIAYAPILDSQIPAFRTEEESGHYQPEAIKINFTHNLAVAYSDVKGMVLKIKSLIPKEGELKNVFLCQAWKEVTINDLKQGYVVFDNFHDINGNIQYMTPGNYYKIQIAYVSQWKSGQVSQGPREISPYSTIGIARCLDKNTQIKLQGIDLSVKKIEDQQTYYGEYTSGTTTSEIVYRYKFDLTNKETGELLETSGWQFPAGTEMKFTHRQWLIPDDEYILSFTATTVNGYEDTVSYTVVRTGTYPLPTVNLVLVANQNSPASKECGYVDIYCAPAVDDRNNVLTQLAKASGVLLRQKVGEPLTRWDELARFELKQNSFLENYSWKDFSVEHGESYIYAIRFYNTSGGKTEWTDMICSTDPLPHLPSIPANNRPPVRVQFENMYLGDGERQLCIRLNPKVSSFKNTILEQKTDTIGGKYPYFFRNGDVKYKEIPISGLISYWMDEYGYFLGMDAAIEADAKKATQRKKDEVSKDPISIINNARNNLGFTSSISGSYDSLTPWYNTQLTNDNFFSERKFKLEVMEWLNNGRPKLFRSATEGNYVVRLMNISLSPDDKLGRMLHTFSATGYEVLDHDIAEMLKSENNVLSFPQWISYEDAIDQERTYVWNQAISGRSITVTVNRAARSAFSCSGAVETEYALVERKDYTKFYEFLLKPGVTPQNVKILIPYKGEYYEDVFTDGSTSVTPYLLLSKLIGSDGKVAVSRLPRQFAIPVNLCTQVTQHQSVMSQGYDAFSNLLLNSNHYLFTIEENQTCSTLSSDLLYDQKIKRLYTLTATPIHGMDKANAWIEIEYEDMTVERLDLSDGLQRIYHNLDDIRRIEKGDSIRLDIYALIQPNASSALGAFILNSSVLGGGLS